MTEAAVSSTVLGPASRRGFLAALAAFTTAGTGSAVAVHAVTKASEPDAVLVALEVRWLQARAYLDEVEARHLAAAKAEERAVEPCPPELFVAGYDWRFVRLASAKRCNSLRYENWHTGGEEERAIAQRWTGPALRAAIAAVPSHYGRAGGTPKLIKRLRSLLPIADARDEAQRQAARRFGSRDLYKACPPAQEAVTEASDAIITTPAETMVGVGVKARFADRWLSDKRLRGGYDLKQPDCIMAVVLSVLAVVPAAQAGA